MLTQVTVGSGIATQSATPGAILNARGGQLGDTIFSELQARYYEQAYRGNIFNAANQGAQATTVALATTYTGLCISNPIGNRQNLVLLKVGIALNAAPVAISTIGILTGFSATSNVTHTAALTPQSQLIGIGPQSTAKIDSQATLVGSPVVNTMLMGGFTAGATPSTGPALIDLEGSIILPAGAYAAIYTLTATSGTYSFTWMEVPV